MLSNFNNGCRVEWTEGLACFSPDIKTNRHDFLPNDVDKVVIKGNTVAVKLTDGKTGTAKCDTQDEFSTFTGFTLAYYKAKNKKCFDLKSALDNCVKSAARKGYKQAILRNYD